MMWDYILVYLLLLLSAGYVFRHNYNRYTIPLFFLLLILTIIKREIRLKYDTLIPAIALIGLIILTAILTGGGDIERYLFFILSTITAYFITQIFSYKKLYRLFSNLIFWICFASIIGWALLELSPSFISAFPTLTNSVGFDAGYLGLTIVNLPSYVGFENRAMGIFWEPGAFQTMIVIAMIGDIFVNDVEKPKRRYVVYFLALALTMSTTGYICCCVLVVILFVKEKRLGTFQMVLLLTALSIVVALVCFREMLPDFIQYTLFTKINALLEYRPGAKIGDASAQKTAYVRMDSIFYPFVEYIKSPIWGIGFAGYDRISKRIGYTNMATFSPINYFAYFGVFYALISIKGFFNTVKRMKASRLCKYLVILLVIIAVSSEDFCGGTACITIFILYGYEKYRGRMACRSGEFREVYEGSIY